MLLISFTIGLINMSGDMNDLNSSCSHVLVNFLQCVERFYIFSLYGECLHCHLLACSGMGPKWRPLNFSSIFCIQAFTKGHLLFLSLYQTKSSCDLELMNPS